MNYSRFLILFALIASLCVGTAKVAQADDVIEFDTNQLLSGAIPFILPPAFEAQLRRDTIEACQQAEAVLDSRIIGFSSEIVGSVRNRLTRVVVDCVFAEVDGPGGILAFAGPDLILSADRVLPGFVQDSDQMTFRGTMTFDIEDVPGLSAAGLLDEVALHEGMHAIGFGTLFEANGLAGQVGGIGLFQYIGGRYAREAYRIESGDPVREFINLEQTGGAGTAGGHWSLGDPVFDQIATTNRQDIMLGFIDPSNPPEVFVSETTWGAFADLGFAVSGINGQFAVKNTNGGWAKTYNGLDPFKSEGFDPNADDNLMRSKIRHTLVQTGTTAGKINGKPSGQATGDGRASSDPYNLRNHSWQKKTQQNNKRIQW
ncbi:MAG: hypothetical protein AAF939_01905 [Planctomycetota bacterium]